MKIFISSVTQGFEACRHAAAAAVETLGHQAIRAEDFGASPDSPQQACLAGVRNADMMILILGSRYGHVQASGLSPTHEEYREARDTRPVLVFIQQDVDPEPQQAEFIREVRGWEQGHFTAEFEDTGGFRDKVIRALHDYVLANEAAPLDEAELASRARALASRERSTGRPDLIVAIAGGPLRTVLRPAELESEDLRRFLLAEALTGADALLTPSLGTNTTISGDALRLIQNQGSGLVALDEAANLLVVQPALENNNSRSGITSLIEDAITERITHAIRFCARVLDHVDPAQRISHIAPVTTLRGAEYLPWRTRAEHERSPNQATMGFGSAEHVVVLSPPVRRRAALLHDTQRMAEDFTVRLRRKVKR
ncbi:MAG: DUF4062 domain-containing protein [Pseudonocardiaceae bacterium]